MTKWGRKNTSSSSSSSTSNNNVFFKSWLSRFKNTKGGDQNQPQSSWISKDDDGVSFEKHREEDFKILCSSDHKLNVSPIANYGTKMKEFIINGETDDSNEGFDQKSPADYYLVHQDSNLEEEWQKLKNQRKSVHIRSKHGQKAKAYNSPRTDIGRNMMKDRRVVVEDAFRAGLDSFAIVKTSYDPKKDFRESMVEMIMEKQLRKPDELEELLACYLTLNCDGFHHLIVSVFRQVWFELNQLHFHQNTGSFDTLTD